MPTSAVSANPLLTPWPGPHGGVPPFDRLQPAHFAPALEAATQQARRETEAVASNAQPPSFANTVAALEQAGGLRRSVLRMAGVWGSSRNSPEMRAVQTAMAPKIAAFHDEVMQNAALFRRVDAVLRSPEVATLTPEQQRLVRRTHEEFVLAGAQLDAAGKARLAEINQRLATLTTRFAQNLLADEEEQALMVTRHEDLAGLSPEQIDAAADEARRRGQPGHWAIANTRSAMEPFLERAESRAVREQAFKLWSARGEHPNADDPRHDRDNTALAVQILALRREGARLLGFASFAHWRLADSMAKEPSRAMALLMQVWQPALQAARADLAEMQAIADADGLGGPIAPWDHRHYAEKLRKARYDFDEASLTPYLQMERVRDAMFWMADELYGLKFLPAPGLPVFDDAMSVYEVRARDGRHVGLWYFDPYARPGKVSGAWMNAYRPQQALPERATPIVSNNCNFIPARPGQPTLISWDNALTMFHEFGHSLHGLLSNVAYAKLSGTQTLLDFVELPSQIHELWLDTPQVLRFLVDAQGRRMPPELLERMRRAARFNRGFGVTEYLASAIVDMRLHMAEEPVTDPAAFEAELDALGLPSAIVMRHRIPQFAHIFSSPKGYAAGYYAYQWASVLDRDAYQAFVEAGDPFDRATAERLVSTVLSVGNAVDPSEAFRRFRGRDPDVRAVLRHDGFLAAANAPALSQAGAK